MNNEESPNDTRLTLATKTAVRTQEGRNSGGDHDAAPSARHSHRAGLQQQRLEREAVGISRCRPSIDLPSTTLIRDVELSTRLRNVFTAAGFATVGEIRETSNANLLSLPDLGKTSVAWLRKYLG